MPHRNRNRTRRHPANWRGYLRPGALPRRGAAPTTGGYLVAALPRPNQPTSNDGGRQCPATSAATDSSEPQSSPRSHPSAPCVVDGSTSRCQADTRSDRPSTTSSPAHRVDPTPSPTCDPCTPSATSNEAVDLSQSGRAVTGDPDGRDARRGAPPQRKTKMVCGTPGVAISLPTGSANLDRSRQAVAWRSRYPISALRGWFCSGFVSVMWARHGV